ncbi:roadblock/LC7 domain-containing protein [Streptomyces spinoverrucosus]|nr:roadblock/LC7 domain-containing protein [Streptomyces spinoverrucosus]
MTDLQQLLDDCAERVSGIVHIAVVSGDGLPHMLSSGLSRDHADQLAALGSGLASLADGAACVLSGGPVTQLLIDMDDGFLLLVPTGSGHTLAVLTKPDCDIGAIGYEAVLLADAARTALNGPGEERRRPSTAA